MQVNLTKLFPITKHGFIIIIIAERGVGAVKNFYHEKINK